MPGLSYPYFECGRFLVKVTGFYVGEWQGPRGMNQGAATSYELMSFDIQYSEWLRLNGRASEIIPPRLWGRRWDTPECVPPEMR